MKRFPNKNKMHIQLIPYDSFCFARASVPFNYVFPHLFLLNSHRHLRGLHDHGAMAIVCDVYLHDVSSACGDLFLGCA